MLIQELFSHTRIHPFEEPQAQDESNEKLYERLFGKLHIEIFNASYLGEDYNVAIKFKIAPPDAVMTIETAQQWVEQFNEAFSEAVKIAAALAPGNEPKTAEFAKRSE